VRGLVGPVGGVSGTPQVTDKISYGRTVHTL